MVAPAPAPAPDRREVWENMIGQEITMDNIDMMLDERPDINDSIVSGWKRLVVFYNVDENHKSTIVWPAPDVMYRNNALAPAPTIG
jgi:hypothetical protein